jgi:TonB-dependent starch-binding outer membrane protein SusC
MKKLHFGYYVPIPKNILLVMKLTFLFLFLNIVSSFASVLSQKISLNLNDVKFSEVISEITKQTNKEFAYSKEVVNLNRRVSITVDNTELSRVLEELLDGTELTFIELNGKIYLGPKMMATTEKEAASQPVKITGKVTESGTGEPIAGANILIEGTTSGINTDIDGKFSLELPRPDVVLVVSFIGYTSRHVETKGQSVIDVQLVPDIVNLEEIVVVGYGTQSKKDISGSISVVTAKNFNVGATQSAIDLIQGKVAGLSVSTTSGDVTSSANVYLRGISSLSGAVSPFYVIDGVSGIGLNSVAPEDIESVSVLKDASATAIYGSRAASGVILITTKKGKEGRTSVEYSSKAMSGFATKKPPVLTASEFRNYAELRGIDISGIDHGANTDWFSEITRQGRLSQEHNLAISGGTSKSNYRASFNYLDNQGLVNGNFLERYNLHFIYNQKAINDKLNISFTGGASKDNSRGIKFYSNVFTILPVYPVKNSDGSWWETYDISGGNPVHSLAENKSLDQGYSLFMNGKADLEIFKGLVAGINLVTGRNGNENGYYNGITTIEGNSDHGSAGKYSSMGNNYNIESTLKYSRKIDKHSLELLLGYSNEQYENRFTDISIRGFISNVFGYDNLSAGDITRVRQGDFKSGGEMNKLVGYFGRINYNFADKYIISATIRHDGSSKFGANNKWGTFPSVSGAWRVSGEPFLKDISFINDLKIRLGYGVTGNQGGIEPYKSLALYSTGPLYYNNGIWENSYQYAQNANPDLKWEQTATTNAGIDFSVMNSRIYGSVDYYIRKTSDLLYTYPVPVPPYLYPNILANVGDISNKGFELVINADVIRQEAFKWSVSFNFDHNKQLITKLSNDKFKIQNTLVGNVQGRGQNGSPTSILREGEEISTFYGLKCLGLDNDGLYIYEDLNKDGTIDSQDNQVIGHALPRATYGLSNTFTYKNFDLSFFLRGVYGNDVFNNDLLQMGNPSNFPSQVYKIATTTSLRDKAEYSSYFIEKGSFVRLQNASIGYTFNSAKNKIFRSCKLYLTGENLFVITKYSGMDPEIGANNGYGGILAQGIDVGGMAPLIRRYILGINVMF